MRVFIACDISHEGLESVIEAVRETGADVKFVDVENTHVTLKFLGEITKERAAEVGRVMEQDCAGILPANAKLSGVGVFPNLKQMRVIWVGVECPTLTILQERFDEALFNIGFKKEKNFKPHLTIGRIRSGRNKLRLKEALNRQRDFETDDFKINHVKLKKSELTPMGPVYSDLKVIGA